MARVVKGGMGFIKERMVLFFFIYKSLTFYIVREYAPAAVVGNFATVSPRKTFYIVQDCRIIGR